MCIRDRFIPPYQGDQMLVAIFAGVTEGAGLALIFIRGGTTGGTDTAARLLGRRFPHFSMGRLMMFIDLCVVVISAIVFTSVESAMYAVIAVSYTHLDVYKRQRYHCTNCRKCRGVQRFGAFCVCRKSSNRRTG